jgi:uncharacterized protein YjiS (DUF1127 family)
MWIPALATPSGALGECLSRSNTPRESARTLRPSGRTFELGALVQPVVRAVKRYRTVKALNQLDEHALADIGLRRDDIDKVASQAANGKLPGAPVRFAPFAALRKAWLRHAAIAQLQRLPDRMLYDIGIERGRIPATVDHLLAKRGAETGGRQPETVRGVATQRGGRGRAEAAVETTHKKAA